MREGKYNYSRVFCGIYSVEQPSCFGRRQAMKLRETVGLNIRNLRNSRGMSQEQLALAADMDRSYISEIELARFSVSVDILEQIALALEVAPKELFNERG